MMPRNNMTSDRLHRDNSTELLRAKRKTRAVLSAQFALKRQLERIDYDIDIIKPAMAEVDDAAANGELPVVEAYEIDQ